MPSTYCFTIDVYICCDLLSLIFFFPSIFPLDDIPIQKENKDEEGADPHQLSSINEEAEDTETAQPSNQRSKKHGIGAGSSITSGITKVGVLQLRKGKDKKKDKEVISADTVDSGKANGKHHDMMGSNDDINVRFTNGEQTSLHNSYTCRTDIQSPKSPLVNSIPDDCNFEFNDSLSNAKFANHANSNADVVILNDGTSILKSILHKSESANGMQNSSMQTAV